jgi:hypothetical protein
LDVEANPLNIDWTGHNLHRFIVENVNKFRLCHLNISETHVKNIPEGIAKNLNSLHWSRVNGIHVPEFGNNLRWINLSASTFEKFPIDLFNLAKIEYINIRRGSELKQDVIKQAENRGVQLAVCGQD